MRTFDVELRMRYTRLSCRPLGATERFERRVQGEDEADAVRQACLCIDRDLEEILWAVNAINVSEVLVEIDSVGPASSGERRELWNPEHFDAAIPVPRHIRVKE